MPAQNRIADILSIGNRLDPNRAARPASGNDTFRQALQQSTADRAEPSAYRQPSAHREPSANKQSSADKQPSADKQTSASNNTPHSATQERATQAHASQRSAEQVDADLADRELRAEARALLASLSEQDRQGLSDDIEAVLTELQVALAAGDLPDALSEALRGLLTDLENGAPLNDIIDHLEAVPLNALPALAAQFPDAQTLQDVLGRRGAAYLSQLGHLLFAEGRSSEQSAPTFLNASSETHLNHIKGNQATLEQMLALNKTLNDDSQPRFQALLDTRLAAQATDSAKNTDPATKAQTVNTLAALDSGVRSQPLAPTDRQFTIQPEVRVPVGQSQWGQAVGERVLWLASQKLASAELRLDPPDLGPVHVRVSSHNDQISVTFVSPQPGVREALDQSANRLREMFSEQGLNLVDVNVSDQSGEQATADGEGRPGRGFAHGSDEDGSAQDDSGTAVLRRSSYLVDQYA